MSQKVKSKPVNTLLATAIRIALCTGWLTATVSTAAISDNFETTSISYDWIRLSESDIDNGWQANSDQQASMGYPQSAWSISGGVLQNSSTNNNSSGEGAVAQVVSVSEDGALLVLSFDYTNTGNDTLYVHLWGFTGSLSDDNDILGNFQASHGFYFNNAEDVDGPGNVDTYNLADGANQPSGSPGTAIAALTGSGRFTTKIPLASLNIPGVDSAADLSYLSLAFARNLGAAPGTTTIDNLEILTTSGVTPEQVKNYSYLYYEHGYPTRLNGRRPQSQANTFARANPDLVFQTGYYSLMLDCDNVILKGYDGLTGSDYRTALEEDVTTFTPTQDFLLRVYQGGVAYDCTSASIQASGADYVRLIESGQYLQRIDHLGLIFKDAVGNTLSVDDDCRLEISAWPDRVTFFLDFSSEVNNPITRTVIQVISPNSLTHLADETGNQARLTLKPQDDLSLGARDPAQFVTTAKDLQNGNALDVSFDADTHAFRIVAPAASVSYPAEIDRWDEHLVEVHNPLGSVENIPLVFVQPIPRRITGTVMMLCDAEDGRPLGIPVQISKNWHRKTEAPTVHEGSWLRGSTLLTLQPGETRRFILRVVYGYWGGAGAVSHSQLSLIGYGGNWKWDENALGAWGESITYDPTHHLGGSHMGDIRPSFTDSYSAQGPTYGWTENVGGGDFLIYRDSANIYRWGKRLKTCYLQTGPNLTEILYTGVTDDDRIRFQYTSRAVSTHDYHRRFHDYRYEFLQDVVSPQRLVFHQIAADYYMSAVFTDYFIGDENGMELAGTIEAGGNTYKGSPIPFSGKWLSIDDTHGNGGSNPAFALRGLIPRAASLNGNPMSVFLHKYGRTWGSSTMLFDLGGTTINDSYTAGDVVEGELEYIMPPQDVANYWGGDTELINRLTGYGTTAWEPVRDELKHNVQMDVIMQHGTLVRNYPLEIQPAPGSSTLADFTIRSGGLGHIPVTIRGAAAGLELQVQRWSGDGAWTDLDTVDISRSAYYQARLRPDGAMDYMFSINRPSHNLDEAWRIRVVTTDDELVSADLNTVTSSGSYRLLRDDVGLRKGEDSAWTLADGVLQNTSTDNSRISEGAVGLMVDLTSGTFNADKLELSFNYDMSDSAETLYVHLWGYVDVSSVASTPTINLGAQNGSAWESAGGAMTAYNLGKANGVFSGTPGVASDAAAILTGVTGLRSYRGVFDLSAFTTAPNSLDGYDYLALGFSRRIDGASSPAAAISDIVLARVPPAPSPPAGLTAQGSSGLIQLDWTDNAESDLAGYTVYRSGTTGSGFQAIAAGLTASEFTDTDPLPGNNYYVVTAWNTGQAESPFSDEALALPVSNQPPEFTTDPVVETNGSESSAYSSTLADNAVDPEADTLTFSKVSGPDWLVVAADGGLSGTPEPGNVGTNTFVVQVNAIGGSDTASLLVVVDPDPQASVLALGGLTAPPVLYADDTSQTPATVNAGETKAVYFAGLDYLGAPTRVYAYIGIPAGASSLEPVPGVVLVHGGGGTAFNTWVDLWTARGYAAISIAVEGQTDTAATQEQKDAGQAVGNWLKHAMPGPARVGIYGDSSVSPISDQWMYHAVADTVLANSLLRNLPEVSADKVGLMGISWGGIITSTAIGIDNRFAFAVPVYGCGNLDESANFYGDALRDNSLYSDAWDPMVRIANATMPVLWFSWPADIHFGLDSQADCYTAAPGPHMVSLVPGMGHGHSPAWNRPESYAFADAIITNGGPWCLQQSAGLNGSAAEVTFLSTKPLDSAILVSTLDGGFTGDRTWSETPATLVSNGGGSYTLSATLPEFSTAWFMNGLSGTLVASSDYQETGAAPPSNVVYDVSANWSSKTVNANDHVFITAGAVVDLDQGSAANTLTVSDGVLQADDVHSLTLAGGLTVESAGAVNQNNGTLSPGGDTVTLDGVATINGGTWSHNILNAGTTGYNLEGSGLLRVQSGALSLPGGAATDMVRLNTDIEISGGTVNIGGQAYVGSGSLNNEIRIIGDGAAITFNTLNQSPVSHSGRFLFILDETGVSTVSVNGWMHLLNALITVDGSAYTGGPATMTLFDSVNLVSLANPSNIVVTGFASQGLTATVVQDDSAGADWMQLVIENANQPPVFLANPVTEINATEGSPYSASLADDAADPENDPLTFEKFIGPAWLSVAADGTLSGTPGSADVGSNSFSVRVTAEGGSDLATLNITVDALNLPPAFLSDPIAEINATEGSAYSASLADNAADPENDSMTFAKISGPAWLSVAADGTLSGTPGGADIGANTFSVRVTAEGGSDTAVLNITVEADSTPLGNYAVSELTTLGTVSGPLDNTFASDNAYEVLTEEEGGGKPAKRRSQLEHTWTVDVIGDEIVTFYVEAHHTANSEGDDFRFAYSADNATYTDMLTVTKTSDDNLLQFYPLPSGLDGLVYVRVVDTDRTQGNNTLDSLFVDHLFIVSEPVSTPPAAASDPDPADGSAGVALTPTLSWTPGALATSHNLYFGTNPSPGGDEFQGNRTETSFAPGMLDASTTYYWAVDGINSAGTTAGPTWSFTTGAGTPQMHVSGITLSTRRSGKNYRAQATVTIVDSGTGQPVQGANVIGDFSYDFSETGSATTDAAGNAVITTSSRIPLPFTVVFTVTDVTAPGYLYNPANNAETSKSGSF